MLYNYCDILVSFKILHIFYFIIMFDFNIKVLEEIKSFSNKSELKENDGNEYPKRVGRQIRRRGETHRLIQFPWP